MRTPILTHLLSRRAALRVAGSAAVGATALTLTTGCSDPGDDTPAEVDALTGEADRARRDAANATAAIAVLPDRASALGVVATERAAHADALEAEITRAASAAASTTTEAAPSTPAMPSTAPPTLEQLRADLAESQRAAADLARTQSGYRAGLLGSISAACGAQQAVLLP